MATMIKIVNTMDFLEVTPEGSIDITTSKQLLIDIAKAVKTPVDYDLLIDFRDTELDMSVTDMYELASELIKHGDTFRRKIAILVLPGVDFNRASFLETCSHNRGFLLDAFTNFETAMRWFLAKEEVPRDKNVTNNSPQNTTKDSTEE